MSFRLIKKTSTTKPLAVYITRLEDLTYEVISDGLEQLPPAWIERVIRFEKLADRKLAFASYALIYQFCLRNQIEIKRVYWKGNIPTIDNGKLFFSLSHSNQLAALVVDTLPVGIDVEYTLDDLIIHDELLNRLSPQQNDAIRHSNNPEREFYIHWTNNEAKTKFNSNLKLFYKSWHSHEPKCFNFEIAHSYVMSVLTLNDYDHVEVVDVNIKKCFLTPTQHFDYLKRRKIA